MFIASCTDSLQIILEHFNGTQWIYDKYFDAIYISRGDFSFTNDKSNRRSNGFFNNRKKCATYVYIKHRTKIMVYYTHMLHYLSLC